MNIFLYINDFIQSLIILLIILYGTKLVNYYYNFYHIYSYLDYEQKFGYFKSNYLINLISKYTVIKKIIVHYILIPIIKLNYLFISIFITLLYSLCYFEFKKILKEQYIKTHKHKKNKKKTYKRMLTESSNDITNTNKQISSLDTNLLNNFINLDNTNLSKDETNLSKDETNLSKDETNLSKDETNLSKDNIESIKDVFEKDFKNDICHIDKIGLDYDDKILNIIEYMSVEEELKNSFKLDNINHYSFSKCYDEIEDQQHDINLNSSNINKLNLLNEIDLLKTNNQHLNTESNINEDNISNYICDNVNEDNISNYICDNINENESGYNKVNDINEYLFIDDKIENISKFIGDENLNDINTDKQFMLINDEQNDLINLEDIDFGSSLENITNIKTSKESIKEIKKLGTIQVMDKKIIKIGKKKKN